jgi:hypothetical protein
LHFPWPFLQKKRDVAARTATQHLHPNPIASSPGTQHADEVPARLEWMTIEAGDDISGLDIHLGRRSIVIDTAHNNAFLIRREFKGLPVAVIQVANVQTHPTGLFNGGLLRLGDLGAPAEANREEESQPHQNPCAPARCNGSAHAVAPG